MLCILLAVGCHNDEPTGKSITYVSGEILNPTSSRVLVLAGEDRLGQAMIDSNNRFIIAVDNLKSGIYHFKNGEEQAVYINRGDSLLLRLDGREFDESLSFTGDGAKRNNLLMELFLLNEEVNKELAAQQAYALEPQEFKDMLISSRVNGQRILDRFLKKNKVNSDFQKIVELILDYENYARLEVYPLTGLRGPVRKVIQTLPTDYYAYREKVDLNMEKAISLYAYQRFLNNYFNQQAFKDYTQDEPYNTSTFSHNLLKMRKINEEVSNDSVQDFLLHSTVERYLMNSNDKKGGELLYDYFMEESSSTYYQEDITELYEANKNIEAGKKIPSVKLIDQNGEQQVLRDIFKKPTVVYFWKSSREKQMRYVHNRVKNLRKRFPEYDYVGIRLDKGQQGWSRYLKTHPDFADFAYAIDEPYSSVRNQLAIWSIFKTLIIDANGSILNGHANMFSTDFEQELLGYLNR